jgi:hypothetical protein
MLSHHQIRVMYEEGVEVVTETIRQLYEMIETDDERVQRLVASATVAHTQRIDQLSGGARARGSGGSDLMLL